MADEAQLTAKIHAQPRNRHAPPADFTGRRRQQPAQQAQQTGFSAAVISLHVQQFAVCQAKGQTAE